MQTFKQTAQVGGISETFRPLDGIETWREQEWKMQQAAALLRLCRDLERSGYLTIGPKERSGDYQRQCYTLSFPDRKSGIA